MSLVAICIVILNCYCYFGRPNKLLAVQILTLIRFMFFEFLCVYFLLRCHVSDVLMPCVHRGVHIRILC